MTTSPALAAQYLALLDERLRTRTPQITLWENYYEGVHRLAFATSRFRQTFGNLFREFADNWCSLIVDASVERLSIQGFRFGQGVDDADDDAWAIWTDNHLDADSRIAHTEAVKLGESYLIVDPNDKTDAGNARITVEHPAQVIVLHDAGNRRRRRAALKEWVDDTGYVYANVYTPDGVFRYQTNQTVNENNPSVNVSGMIWPQDFVASPAAFLGKKAEWIPRIGAPFYTKHDLAVVPVIPIRNNPTLKVGGRSDIANVIPLQDAVNKTIADMMIASEFASFPQRWATGIEIPRDPESGEPTNDQRFLASVARVWAVEGQDVKFGQFAASDLKNYVNAVEMLIQHVAALTRTPPHYLLGQSGNFPSGDSLTATETGLVAKVKSKQPFFGEGHIEALKLGFKVTGNPKANEPGEVVWTDPEQRIRATRIDGAMKMSTMGVPQDALWEEVGATPQQIRRWHAMKKEMGLNEYGEEFAVPPPLPPGAKAGQDPHKNQLTNIAAETRVSRIND